MAKLHKAPYPGDWRYRSGENWTDYDKRIELLENAIPKDRIMRFPVADGLAQYFVVSEKPFVLQHIPARDAWQIPYAHIKGLTIKDLKRQRADRAFWGAIS